MDDLHMHAILLARKISVPILLESVDQVIQKIADLVLLRELANAIKVVSVCLNDSDQKHNHLKTHLQCRLAGRMRSLLRNQEIHQGRQHVQHKQMLVVVHKALRIRPKS